MNTYNFSLDSLRVSRSCGVLVVGGGTSGAVAAVSAARQGADALIVEQYGSLGGSQTLALVTPVMHSHIEGDPQSSAIAEEIRARLQAVGGAIEGDGNKGSFDTLALKMVLEDLVIDSGAKILYHTTLVGVVKDGDKITHGVVFNSDGLSAIAAESFIDATADGALSVLAGASFESGNDKGFNQAVSLRFVMENVDTAAFAAYNSTLGEQGQRDYPLLHAASVDGNPRWPLNAIFHQAFEDGLLTKQDIKYFQCFSLPGRPGAVAFNCPELGTRRGVLDPDFLTDRQIEGKRAIRRVARFLIERMPGFQHAHIAEVAPMVGIRESRRVVCEYMLTGEDVTHYNKHDDYIAVNNYPVDIHDAGDGKLAYLPVDSKGRFYHLPMRCLVVKGLRNLFVVGRCIGADFIAQSSVRVQGTCRAGGEAAGIAAAMCAKGGCPAREIDGARVREVMLARGAVFA